MGVLDSQTAALAILGLQKNFPFFIEKRGYAAFQRLILHDKHDQLDDIALITTASYELVSVSRNSGFRATAVKREKRRPLVEFESRG